MSRVVRKDGRILAYPNEGAVVAASEAGPCCCGGVGFACGVCSSDLGAGGVGPKISMALATNYRYSDVFTPTTIGNEFGFSTDGSYPPVDALGFASPCFGQFGQNDAPYDHSGGGFQRTYQSCGFFRPIDTGASPPNSWSNQAGFWAGLIDFNLRGMNPAGTQQRLVVRMGNIGVSGSGAMNCAVRWDLDLAAVTASLAAIDNGYFGQSSIPLGAINQSDIEQVEDCVYLLRAEVNTSWVDSVDGDTGNVFLGLYFVIDGSGS